MLPKIMSEIKNKLSLSGGTVTGDVTINASLIADNLKAKAELLNPSTSSTTSSDINDNQIATTGFVHSVVSNNKYVHPTSTASGNYGTSKDTILNYEDSFSVPYITVNEFRYISITCIRFNKRYFKNSFCNYCRWYYIKSCNEKFDCITFCW